MKKNRSKRINVILLCLGLIGAILTIWTLWGNMALMVSEITIISDHLPSAFSGYRIAHIPFRFNNRPEIVLVELRAELRQSENEKAEKVNP